MSGSDGCRTLKNEHGDRTVESVLLVQDFQSQDLKREFNCSVRNARGFETRRAQLEEEGERFVFPDVLLEARRGSVS